MASHKLQITFDEETGLLTTIHRCVVEVNGHAISHARDVELEEGATAALMSIIATNRATMEAETGELAVVHVAAVTGSQRRGITPLKIGGSLGAVGSPDVSKNG